MWTFFRLLKFGKSINMKTVDTFDPQCKSREKESIITVGIRATLGWELGGLGSSAHCYVDTPPTPSPGLISLICTRVSRLHRPSLRALQLFRKASSKAGMLCAECQHHLVAVGHNPSPLPSTATWWPLMSH